MSHYPLVLSKHGHKLTKTIKPHRCKGCGRLLPGKSYVLRWNVWTDGLRNRFDLCDDCENVVYGCNDREKLDCTDKYMVRALCSRCDRYPTCDLVDYQRKEKPGKWYFKLIDLDKNEDE